MIQDQYRLPKIVVFNLCLAQNVTKSIVVNKYNGYETNLSRNRFSANQGLDDLGKFQVKTVKLSPAHKAGKRRNGSMCDLQRHLTRTWLYVVTA